MQTAKNIVREILENLPDDASYDEIIYEIQLNKKLDCALNDIGEKRTFSHEEGLNKLKKWLK